MSKGKHIDPETRRKLAVYAATHSTRSTARTFKVSEASVRRSVELGLAGEFGQELAQDLNNRPAATAAKKPRHKTAPIEPERLAEVAAYAIGHTARNTAKAFGVSLSTVQRAVSRAKEGEFGESLAHGLINRRGAINDYVGGKKKARAKRKSKVQPAQRPRRKLPPRGTDLDAMVALMLEKAEHHEAMAAKLRAAAAALTDE